MMAYSDKSFAGSFGIQESKVDGSLIDEGTICGIGKTSEKGRKKLGRALGRELRRKRWT